MPSEDHKTQKKIQCWIPLDTWDKIVSMGYTSPTIAVTKAFEKLLEDPREDPQQVPNKSQGIPELKARNKEDITGYKENIKSLNSEIERLHTVIMEAPDRSELSRLQARTEELEKHNSTLMGELEKASQRENDLKNMHNNYMLQVQSLINQKAIEGPGEKKKWWKFW